MDHEQNQTKVFSKKVSAFFLATRPKTLIASLCPVLIGVTLAFKIFGSVSVLLSLCILSTAFLIQIATNFFNDALDFEEGRDDEKRLGPKRASLEGLLRPKDLKYGAIFCLFIAAVLGSYLVYVAGVSILLIGLSALVLAYLYTGTSLSLASTGTADLFVILYFGVLAVWGTSFILAGQTVDGSLISGLQCGLLCNVLLLINNLRDQESDELKKKETLVVKYGRNFGLGFLFLCLFTPYLLNIFWMGSYFYRSGFWTFLSLPLAIYIFIKIYSNKPSREYNKLIGFAALNQLIFVVMFCLGALSF